MKDSTSLFEFVPAAQVKETRETFCYMAMSGSTRQDLRSSQVSESDESIQVEDDDETMNYATRRSREVPPYRNYYYENHIEYCYGHRHQSAWKDSQEHTKLIKERGLCKIYGPREMKVSDHLEIAMDSLSWIESGPLSSEYSDFLKWKTQFVRFLIGWVTQKEEDCFGTVCKRMFVDLTSGEEQSYYSSVTRGLSTFLRQSRHQTLFSGTGTVELSNVFAQMLNSPSTRNMTGQEFAAMLLVDNKWRFFVEMHINWEWNPYAAPPTEPFEIRIGCHQGQISKTINPPEAHHVLTQDEAGSLGWIFHVISRQQKEHIEQFGLKRNLKGKR